MRWICLFGLACAVGCGSRVALEGVVTLNGQPLDEATLVFLRQKSEGDAAGARRANALTDSDGRFRAKTSDDIGVVPGTYKVTVSKRVRPTGTPEPKTIREAMALMPKMKEVVPDAYRDETKTPLVVEVPKGGNKEVQLEINGKSP